MGLHTGLTGYVKVGEGVEAKIVAHINDFSLDMSTEMVEDVSFGNQYKEKVATIKDWSATSNGAVDFSTDSGQKTMFDAFEAGTPLDFAFGLTETMFFEGKGFIETLTVNNAADGKAEISISVAGTNGITLQLPA